jgi:hypothetical protein
MSQFGRCVYDGILRRRDPEFSGWFHTGDGGTIDDEGHLPGSLQRLDRAREAYSAIPVTHIVVQAQPRSAVSRPDGSTPELGQNWQEGSE